MLYIIRGPCASGKSTVANLLRNRLEGNTAIFCPDFFYWDVCWKKDDDSETVYEALYRLTDLYLSRDYNVILEGILSGRDENGLRIDRFMELGKGYGVKPFFFFVDLKTSIERDKERGELVGEKEVRRVYEKSIDSIHADDVEIDAENNTPEEIVRILL